MLVMVCFLISMLASPLSLVCENSLSYILRHAYLYFNKK